MNDKNRQKIYESYVSDYANFAHGKQNLADIKKQFPVWTAYYGKHLPENKEAKIFECAAGNGGLLYWLQSLGYKNISGMDVSPEQVQESKQLGIEGVMQGDCREWLTTRPNSYDCIIARDLIEHFSKDEVFEFLEMVRNALRSDGVFIIQTPSGESLFAAKYRYIDFTHEVIFTHSSLRQVLRAAGFKEEKFYPTGPVVHGVISLMRFILWKMIVLKLKLYLLIESGSWGGIFTENMIAVAKKK